MKRIGLLFILPILFSGCSNLSPTPTEPKGPGSILTGKDEQGIKIGDIFAGKPSGSNLPINALLWRASLDIISTIPLSDIDAFGGTIVTDWYSLPETPLERIKVTIFVLGRELRSDGIRVVVNTQTRQANGWLDAGIDDKLSRQLEELILTRAREIRGQIIGEN